jgi:Na+/H+ antiporter NhaA
VTELPGVTAQRDEADRTVANPGRLRRLAGALQAARRDGHAESLAAVLLLAATVVAMVWANTPWGNTYTTFWHTSIALRAGNQGIDMDVRSWVNDGLMTLFFFVVGLDVKREFTMGELTTRARATAPMLAALGGMVLPALIFWLLNHDGEASKAWGIVISTDTAFLLGALALVGPRRGARLRVFLLTLAVADDIGALMVIALRYTAHLHPIALACAVVGLIVIAGLRRLRAWRGVGYAVAAIVTWVALYESGVQPTLAGVLIALILPVYPPQRQEVERAGQLTLAFRQSPNPEYARAARLGIDRAVSVNERLMRLHEPYTSFLIVPLFALANAGVRCNGAMLTDALASPITWGVVIGLVGGKFLGIWGVTTLLTRWRPSSLAPGIRPQWLAGGAALSGIGFTIALFIIGLALPQPWMQDQARIGVLAATVLATILGGLVFAVDKRVNPCTEDEATALLRPVDPMRDHIRGPADAPLTIVEYGDFECPFCSKATGSLQMVRKHFGDDLRYVFRHLPLEEYHPSAPRAALAAEAAGAQAMFWEMHDLLFANHDALSPEDLHRYAEQLELNIDMFDDDMQHRRLWWRIEDDAVDAESSEVNGTPTFYLGYGDDIPRRHEGPYDAAALIVALEQLRFEAGLRTAEPAEPTDPVAPAGSAAPSAVQVEADIPLWTVPVHPAPPTPPGPGTSDDTSSLRRFAGNDSGLADRVDEVFGSND